MAQRGHHRPEERAITYPIDAELKRRSAIESVIGHLRIDGCMDCCRLKGALGDALNAVLVAAGQNIWLLLRAMVALYVNCLAGCWRSAVPESTISTPERQYRPPRNTVVQNGLPI